MNDRLNIRKGVTAIELLIIVAIVVVLAMVAVPRLIESQTRAKLARTKSEMRKGKMALEAFHFDHKWYPPDGFWLMGNWGQVPGALPWVDANCTPWFTPQVAYELISAGELNLWRFDNCLFLTTPVAYLSTFPKDPFVENDWWWAGTFVYGNLQDRWKFNQMTDPSSQPYIIDASNGATDIDGCRVPYWILRSVGPDGKTNSSMQGTKEWTQYDPTNGTVSNGDIFMIGPQ